MIKQKIKYDNAAILQQSLIYTDEYRILMEYIDNSIDAAEKYIDAAEKYIDAATKRYSKDIVIEIKFKGGKKSDQKIVISDNCSGIEINPAKPMVIFGSQKRNDPATNGMFGMGMFSFFSLCDKMKVETTSENSDKLYTYEINNDTFNESVEPEVRINETLSPLPVTGTTITLSDFHEGKFEEIDPNTLKSEIEKHFELLLSRNITIKIIDK